VGLDNNYRKKLRSSISLLKKIVRDAFIMRKDLL
jgi:hypothetical protein